MSNDERCLLAALRNVKKGELPELDGDYKKALETLGFATFSWDTSITPLGERILALLEPDEWGS